MLPVGTTEYAEGYGLDRLRELVLTELTSATTESGTHLYQSLGVLFRLVNDGYPPETLGPEGVVAPPSEDEGGLRFEALRADLFSRDATALVDEVGLGNRCLQQVSSAVVRAAPAPGQLAHRRSPRDLLLSAAGQTGMADHRAHRPPTG